MHSRISHFVIFSAALHLLALTAWSVADHEAAYHNVQAGQPLHLNLTPKQAGEPKKTPPPRLAAPLPPPSTFAEVIAPSRLETRMVAVQQLSATTPAISHAASALMNHHEPGAGGKTRHDTGPDILPSDATTAVPGPDSLVAAKINKRLTATLVSYFSYPVLARRHNWEGAVSIGLRIEADGQLSHIRLVKSSGHSLLDRAALRSLQRIASLPEAGGWLKGRHFDTVVPIEYRLTDS